GEAIKDTQVQTLDLRGNRIGDAGAKALSQALLGSNVTLVIGITSPELTETLLLNLGRQKGPVIALGLEEETKQPSFNGSAHSGTVKKSGFFALSTRPITHNPLPATTQHTHR
ncbi:MAG: leucine-rich repeat domain-containing protein, partial [Legionellaceae bacterium]|nr:leucine-rich repeat domain-containing protein [Legionellaceae bacterium]